MSRVWKLQDGWGYVFLPWIEGDAETKEQRIRGYHEGSAFKWPQDKQAILSHLKEHEDDDLYWCPAMFEKHTRRMEFAMDEHALWADLDEADPRQIDDEFRPTIAWETSPGHFQALWISRIPMLGASWPGNENQRLTYYLGADRNGWDTTQLLRVPGWRNHKPSYRGSDGSVPQGTVLWTNGPQYSRRQFADLPDIRSSSVQVGDIIENDVDSVDVHDVWGRVRLKVSKRVREFIAARQVAGDRSEILWEICRELADAGCTVVEIVAITRQSVWNKYSGRNDELLRLSTEAAKAVDEKPEDTDRGLEEIEKPKELLRFAEVLANIKPPQWLIKNIWTVGACGFIAGQPKSWKSWFALDMALSIATGASFLGHFRVEQPGPVLYVQEEDPPPVLKKRYAKMKDGKAAWKVEVGADGEPIGVPGEELTDDPDIAAVLKSGFLISNEGWQEWLRDQLEQGMNGTPYRALMLDPLMMMLGDVEENRAAQMMEKVFRPLKILAHEFNVSVIVIHHMRKGDPRSNTRGGQLMLGSVANHAWTEDSLYLSHTKQGIEVEAESKSSTGGKFMVTGLRNQMWTPQIINENLNGDDTAPEGNSRQQIRRSEPTSNGSSRRKPPGDKLRAAIAQLGAGQYTSRQVADVMGISQSGAYRQLTRAGLQRNGSKWIIPI